MDSIQFCLEIVATSAISTGGAVQSILYKALFPDGTLPEQPSFDVNLPNSEANLQQLATSEKSHVPETNERKRHYENEHESGKRIKVGVEECDNTLLDMVWQRLIRSFDSSMAAIDYRKPGWLCWFCGTKNSWLPSSARQFCNRIFKDLIHRNSSSDEDRVFLLGFLSCVQIPWQDFEYRNSFKRLQFSDLVLWTVSRRQDSSIDINWLIACSEQAPISELSTEALSLLAAFFSLLIQWTPDERTDIITKLFSSIR